MLANYNWLEALEKIEAILVMEHPKNLKQLRGFMQAIKSHIMPLLTSKFGA